MNILALPAITSIILIVIFKTQTKAIPALAIVLGIIGLAGGLAWTMVYSSWEDTLVISGLIFLGGFLFSLGLNPNGNGKNIYLLNLGNRLAFIWAAVSSLLGGLAGDIPSFGYYAEDITTYTSLAVVVFGALIIWRSSQKFDLAAKK